MFFSTAFTPFPADSMIAVEVAKKRILKKVIKQSRYLGDFGIRIPEDVKTPGMRDLEFFDARSELLRSGLAGEITRITGDRALIATPDSQEGLARACEGDLPAIRIAIIRKFGTENSASPFPPTEIPEVLYNIALERLVADGLVDEYPDRLTYRLALTPQGEKEREKLSITAFNLVSRRVHTRENIMKWAYERQGEPGQTIERWSVVGGARFHGDDISLKEGREACAYLEQRDMITLSEYRKRTDGIWWGLGEKEILLRPRGFEFVESGITLAEFQSPRPSPSGSMYITVLPDAHGVIIGEQENFTQNNTQGIDPAKFVQLAGYVGQVSATLNLTDSDRSELERTAEELHDEATLAEPSPGRLRALGRAVRDSLASAATTIAAQVGVQMADEALNSLLQ
ncbi:hypothetical protein [Streptomyces pseudovenezuelae]|uniref:hypothetical protein n=1 Tax=Streptomyces pseudovenezuelae TaxID=67350 RepID=UPI002E80B52B|nr:hypothetical protein [Streptomyces pseudovenezuelae]WUA93897.1 hypothetical protein OHO81_44140 [Streptomyces pseudovenezuelae]